MVDSLWESREKQVVVFVLQLKPLIQTEVVFKHRWTEILWTSLLSCTAIDQDPSQSMTVIQYLIRLSAY